MTPVALNRISAEIARHEGATNTTFYLKGGLVLKGPWQWFNKESPQLDVIIEVHIAHAGADRVHYVHIEDIVMVTADFPVTSNGKQRPRAAVKK